MDIYIIETNCTDKISEELLERYRKKDFKDKKQEKIHSLSYLMLDRLLKENYKLNDREIEFYGKKPVLFSQEKQFSISHSGCYIAIGISDFNCGIDIEQMKLRDFKKIAKRKNFKCDSLKDFYKEWTLYEAKYKLNTTPVKQYQFQYENFIVTACSENKDEKFQIYVQNGDNFNN